MIPALIDGVHTTVDEATLTPNHSVTENDNERTEVTEWLLDGVVVHRSVHMHLKQALGIESILGKVA
jgi:hypothetical protein